MICVGEGAYGREGNASMSSALCNAQCSDIGDVGCLIRASLTIQHSVAVVVGYGRGFEVVVVAVERTRS